MTPLVEIDKPYVEVYKTGCIFGTGENSIEYSWEEIADLVRADYENYMRYHR